MIFKVGIGFVIVFFVLGGISQLYAQKEKELVGYWNFDEGKGEVAKDSSGNANDGAITNAEWVDGKFGKALKFNGEDAYVDCGDDASLDMSDRVTLEFWANVQGNHSADWTPFAGSGRYVVQAGLATDPRTIVFQVCDLDDAWHSTGSYTMPTGWHHIVGTFDNSLSSNNVNLYVDGVLRASANYTGQIKSGDASVFRISSIFGRYYNGLIDEVKIYNRALSTDEVKLSYLKGSPERVKRVKGSLFIEDFSKELFVTGESYRLHFYKESSDFAFEIKDSAGNWHKVTKRNTLPEFAYLSKGKIISTLGLLTTFNHIVHKNCIVVGLNMAISLQDSAVLNLHFLCVEKGVLVRFAISSRETSVKDIRCWTMPRMLLNDEYFDGYLYWDSEDKPHTGLIADLGERASYAGLSLWEQKGDVSKSLSAKHPALLVRSQKIGISFGFVYLDYSSDWENSHMFIQRYNPTALYFYPGCSPFESSKELWAWLSPFPEDVTKIAEKVEHLLILGKDLKRNFTSIAPDLNKEFLEPVPDFSLELRRPTPAENINEAIVYTINENTNWSYAIELAKKVGSDVLIRAWFRWGSALNYARDAKFVQQAHELGALFGGGTTCSALYHGENKLIEEQVLDMATRGPDGELVDAWGERGCRHGTLSNPKYVDYIISWGQKQIDAGVDYLFMDEHTAAIQTNEGYDDYSIRDFRIYLIENYCNKNGWSKDDNRWQEKFKIGIKDPEICPDGTMSSFNYGAYLKETGFTKNPLQGSNPFVQDWYKFKNERDDRAWKRMVDELHAYGLSKGRKISISANGVAKYVDLQVLGMWNMHVPKDEGCLDLSENWIPRWNSEVRRALTEAGQKVPVVFFHDWGFGPPPFPWMELSPSEKKLWIRVRGAEIYASGGFFAFPILGPFGCDALRDGTIREIARQTKFYQTNKQLYLEAEFSSLIHTESSFLSLALWKRKNSPALILHIINRKTVQGNLEKQNKVTVDLPFAELPKKITVLSPDWEGTKIGKAQKKGQGISVEIPELEAYAVVVLDYEKLPE